MLTRTAAQLLTALRAQVSATSASAASSSATFTAAGATAAGTSVKFFSSRTIAQQQQQQQPPSPKVPAALWSLGKLNHIAIAVPNAASSAKFYKNVLGAKVSEVQPLPEHGVYTVFVDLGNTKIELLEPLGADSPIKGFLEKKPEGGMHHICIEVDNIQAAMKQLTESKIRALSKEPKIGAHGKPVVFLHPKDCHGVLVELEQA